MFAVPSVSQCLTFPIDALTFTRDLTWNHVIARKVKKSFFSTQTKESNTWFRARGNDTSIIGSSRWQMSDAAFPP